MDCEDDKVFAPTKLETEMPGEQFAHADLLEYIFVYIFVLNFDFCSLTIPGSVQYLRIQVADEILPKLITTNNIGANIGEFLWKFEIEGNFLGNWFCWEKFVS